MIAKIELLRFVFFACIVLLHCNLLVRGIDIPSRLCQKAAFGVEFFFIVSGALMARSALKYSGETIGAATLKFLGRKIGRLWPKLLIAAVITVAVDSVLGGKYGFVGAMMLLIESLGEICTLQMAGLSITMINGVTWYISAMLLGMLLLYPLLIRNRDVFVGVIAPILIIFIYGWLLKYNRALYADANVWAGNLVKPGLLRAIAGLSLGVEAFELGRYISGLKLTKKKLMSLKLLELGGVIISLLWVVSSATGRRYFEFYIVFILAGSIAVMFSNAGLVLPKIVDKISCYLGSLVLVMYINHRWIIMAVKYSFPKCETYQLYIIASIIVLLLTFIFSAVYNFVAARILRFLSRSRELA